MPSIEHTMKVLKFKINETHFETFKTICSDNDITVKHLLYLTMTEAEHTGLISDYIPEDFNDNLRNITLKVSNDMHKGVAKRCTKLDVSVRDYMQYLIYKCLDDHKDQ